MTQYWYLHVDKDSIAVQVSFNDIRDGRRRFSLDLTSQSRLKLVRGLLLALLHTHTHKHSKTSACSSFRSTWLAYLGFEIVVSVTTR